MKRALICGIKGQDGAYLAQLLLDKGYLVYGTSRNADSGPGDNLVKLGIQNEVTLLSMALADAASVSQVFSDVAPDEIYNLAGQTSVGLSFEQPVETFESICIGTFNILEALRSSKSKSRFYNACSSECFGNTEQQPASETTLFQPRSPYAVAKAAAYWQVANYREAYGIAASSGILFNHESPLRPTKFVTRKIVTAACRIARGAAETLKLGNIEIQRDWGWAPEYVEAMWRILQHESPEDFVVATGVSRSLEDFVQLAFGYFDLDWREHVESDESLFRPSDLSISRGNPAKVNRLLGWSTSKTLEDIVSAMVEDELAALDA